MRKTEKILSCIIPICFLSCFLMGCPSPNDESKQAEEHVSQAIPIIEEEVTDLYPHARIKTKSFYGIGAPNMGPDHLVTDWVSGIYLDGGEKEVMMNVITKDIYVSSEWYKINSFAMESVRDLYGLDLGNMDGSVHGCIEKPYCIDDPDKYGNLEIWDMLPLGTEVDDDYARNLLNDENYRFVYELQVNEDVDMIVFEETDFSSLGSNVHIHVKQYNNECFKYMDTPNYNADPGTDEPIATFDSQNY